MGVNQLHSLGREQDVRFLFEDSFGTWKRPALTAVAGVNRGVQVNNAAIQKEPQVIVRKFTNPLSRDHSSTIKHKTKCEASVESDLVPSDTVGGTPDIHPLMYLGIGGCRHYFTITIDNYATMNNDTFTIPMYTNQNVSATQTFIEGTDWNDGGSNTAAAIALAAEIDSRPYLHASVTTPGQIDCYTDDVITWMSNATSLVGATFTFTKIEYICNTRQRKLGSLTMHQKMSTLSRSLTGCWVEETNLKVDSSSQPKLMFKLGGKDVIVTGVTGIASITDSDTLVVDKESTLEANSLVCFEDVDGEIDDNSGAGYLVSSVSGTTVNFSTAHNAADTDTIFPFLPTATFYGEALGNLDGSVTIDGDEFDIINLDLTIKQNIKPHDDNVFQETVSDYTQSFREVEGKFSIRCNEDEVEHLTKFYADQLTDYELVLQVGSTAGSRMTITMPRINKTKMPVTTPGDGEVMMDIEFVALASDYTASDSITITLD